LQDKFSIGFAIGLFFVFGPDVLDFSRDSDADFIELSGIEAPSGATTGSSPVHCRASRN
jgi:hypothetical protein